MKNMAEQNADQKKKKTYKTPEIKSEKVSIAALGRACNGRLGGHGGHKANAPCTTLLS
jgi:hypothetical protein